MDRDESTVSAVSMWAFYMVGAILLIASTMGALVSIVFLSSPPDGSVSTRIAAGVGLVVSIGVFLLGRMLTDDYRIYPSDR